MAPSPIDTTTLLSATDHDSLVGRIIAGKFALRRCIGVGSSGTVYQADQTALGRTVAVKVLRPELTSDPRFARRFNDEALAASRLNHPNVVSIIDFGQTDDALLYLVMEYLRGSTLTQVLRTEHLTTKRITDMVVQILSALEEAHACGVVHADLKADNIIVEHRRGGWDLVKVVDFGIARLVGGERDPDEERTICGTPEYMAPEVIQGLEPTFSADLYAVGVMIYELLVGYTPFSGSGSMEVLRRHLEDKPVPPSERETDRVIDPRLEEATLRALAKSPAERFASATAFREFLEGGAKPAATAAVKDVLCAACGTTSPSSFKFCPECGQPRKEVSREFEVSLEDTGHDEIWSDDTPTADLGTQDLKHLPVAGIAKPVSAAIASEDTDFAGSILPLPMLGRDGDLQACLEFLAGERFGTLQLRGDRGSGSSRLLREACQYGAQNDGTVVFLVGPDPTGLAAPFYPVRALLAAILQLPHFCSYNQIGEALSALGLNKRDQPGIGELFGHQGGGLWQLEAAVRRRELVAATMRVLRAAGKHFGATLAFEDYDAYDVPSKELLRELAESNQRSPSLRLLVTTGGATVLPWSDITTRELRPFTDEEMRALVAHFATRGHPDLVTVDELRTLCKGQPGHIQQLVRYVIEGGAVEGAPDSLADLIAARLDLLPSAARRILQACAVFGTEVRPDDLSNALAASVGKIELQAGLQLLDARELLRNQGEVLSFHQTLVRDVAYESTPLDVRRNLHEAAGETLSASISDPAILGTHAERAGDMLRAAELLTRAGDNAVHQLDDLGAASLFNRALSASRHLMLREQSAAARTRFVSISLKLADALRCGGESHLARGIVAEAANHCSNQPALRAQLLRSEAQLRASEGAFEQALDYYREAIGLAIPVGASELLAELYLDLATMHLRAGEPQVAIRELEEGIDLITLGEGAAAKSAPQPFWRLLLRLAQLYGSQANPAKALTAAQHALRHAVAVRSPIGPARVRATLAGLLEATGDLDKAEGYRRRAVEDMRKLGDRRGTAELLLAGSRVSQNVQRITPASVREARLLAEEIGWTEGVRRARRASSPPNKSA